MPVLVENSSDFRPISTLVGNVPPFGCSTMPIRINSCLFQCQIPTTHDVLTQIIEAMFCMILSIGHTTVEERNVVASYDFLCGRMNQFRYSRQEQYEGDENVPNSAVSGKG